MTPDRRPRRSPSLGEAPDPPDDVPALPGNVLALRRVWARLPAPEPGDVTGDLVASFVAPLRHVAPVGLGVIGLRDWYGKRLRRDGDLLVGANLVRIGDGLAERLPMTARVEPSLVDGRPALAVSYGADAPLPWRRVRDELRVAPDGTVIGMTLLAVPALGRLGGLPFLLRRAES